MAPRFRADQIGSLLRPPALLEARSAVSSANNTYDIHTDDRIKQAEKEAIEYAVRKQLELSIRPICSGEYNRHIFYGGFFETLQGMTAIPDLPIPSAFRTDFPTTTALAKQGATTRAAVVATGPIRWTHSAYLPEWRQLTSHLPESLWRECKLTLPSPTYQHIQLKPGTAFTPASGYASDAAYFADLVAAFAAELRALHAAGCRNVQLDDPTLTYFCSHHFLAGCAADGTDPRALLSTYLDAHAALVRAARRAAGPDLHLGVHLCRGNMAGGVHFVTGDYEGVAAGLFARTGYDSFLLEFDDEGRSGGFAPLRFVPRGRSVVLGLVTTKSGRMEEMGALKARVEEAAGVMAEAWGSSREEALDCLAVSPQCGFSSISVGGAADMTMERMWEKLVLVRDLAREIWGEG